MKHTILPLIFTGLIGLSACAMTPQVNETPVPVSCGAEGLQDNVGLILDDNIRAVIAKASSKEIGSVRYTHPNEIMTMEYRFDRITVNLDEEDKILSIRCG